ncbi:putative protease Do-like 14 [Camellia lanceoleosa]|uniref:Protease Do-like 14 n=1 Tax=Camellia lanceoleosa TaxID=1840588 RepID=A0ACC0FWB8_9ERIC|nr:putative protease Do-like 14 [Camellia lanceoleosa]
MKLDHRRPEEKMNSVSPWKRKRPEREGSFVIPRHSIGERFDHFVYANMDVDIDTKRAALKASPSVVCLTSLTGGKMFACSGTIIECEDVNGTFISTILTSATLLRSPIDANAILDDIKVDVYVMNDNPFNGHVIAYDFHFNIATISIEIDVALPTAIIRPLDDSISIDPSEISASGTMSLDCCKFDCKELFRANCIITKSGIGGPLINRYGEVIGVNFYDDVCTPFLPINIVSQCLLQFKKNRKSRRPWLGLEMTNLYAASVGKLEKIISKFNISKGVLVEKVIKGSPAERAGILDGDVIIQCGKKVVQSFLEFYNIIWKKVGKKVGVIVIRESYAARLYLEVFVDETRADKVNR